MERYDQRTMSNELIEGVEKVPTVALETCLTDNHGMAYGGRPLWSRSHRSSPS